MVFADNHAKLELFMLYPNATTNTRVNIIVLNNAAGNSPVEGAEVQLTNTPLAAKETDAEGLVGFESVNMPELLNISITVADLGTFAFENQAVVAGTSNDLELRVG